MIAALFVQKGGIYYGLPHVEPWDEERDARTYAGPHPVIAHPPCARWGNFWRGGMKAVVRTHGIFGGFDASIAKPGDIRKLGDDDGCFAAALAAVRKYGGVLEHPMGSRAWSVFALRRPPRHGGWVPADRCGGWTCCVEQGAYGHYGRKATWLYACKLRELPGLRWQAPGSFAVAGRSADMKKAGAVSRLSHRERAATPLAFRDMLIALVEP